MDCSLFTHCACFYCTACSSWFGGRRQLASQNDGQSTCRQSHRKASLCQWPYDSNPSHVYIKRTSFHIFFNDIEAILQRILVIKSQKCPSSQTPILHFSHGGSTIKFDAGFQHVYTAIY